MQQPAENDVSVMSIKFLKSVITIYFVDRTALSSILKK